MLWKSGWKIKDIDRRLRDEGTSVSETSLYLLISKFAKTGFVRDIKRAPRQSILKDEHYQFIDEAMERNDELTAYNLWSRLKEAYPNLRLSVSTVRRARKDLGWVSTKPKYCQLIREANKEKRLKWCADVSSCGDNFADVVWTDECTVELQQHSLRCFRKKDQLKKLKPRPKHPLKLHIWGGISCRGATSVVIFEGILIATKLLKIYEASLIPFVKKAYPDHHRLMQDNDPKHTSRVAQNFLLDNEINWWKTPPESPDLNPIENIWGSMKRFLRDRHKPTNKASLIEGIKIFWKTLSPEVCRRYVNHIQRVIPVVIEEDGGPSSY